VKRFDEWNEVKKRCDGHHKKFFFKERDIFYTKVGEKSVMSKMEKVISFKDLLLY